MAQYTVSKTVRDDFWDAFQVLTQNEVRSAIGAFLLLGEEVFKTLPNAIRGRKGTLIFVSQDR